MQKTVIVDNKPIVFECNLLSLLIYKNQFGRNLLDDMNDIDRKRLVYENADEEIKKSEKAYNILWTLAKTANENIKSPDIWLDDFEEFDTFSIWSEMSANVVRSSLHYDKRFKTIDSDENTSTTNSGQRTPTAEELTAIFLELGLSVRDFKYLTIGMGINLIKSAEIREKKRRNIEVIDPEEQYLKLKANEPMVDELHAKGEISEQKYKAFKDVIRRWEDNG